MEGIGGDKECIGKGSGRVGWDKEWIGKGSGRDKECTGKG